MSEITTVESWDNKDKLDLIRKTIANTVTADEFELFIAMARASGLDPLQRQIYAVSRQGKMTVQTGIDGFRLIADRTGKHMGTKGPYIEMGDDGFPISAKTIVLKLVSGHIVEFEATCYWDEYAPKFNGKLSPMWEKMKRTMIGKCSEALALRRAFPANLSGLYTSEEMDQADIKPVNTSANEFTQVKPELTIVSDTKHKKQIKAIESKVIDAPEETLIDIIDTIEERLLSESKINAKGGMTALTNWFMSLTKEEQEMIKPFMSEPKKTATEFDKANK